MRPWSTFLTSDFEGPAARCLPLFCTLFRFGPCATQDLQEVSGTPTHTAVNISFARFDVVVEVVAESLNVGDDFFASCGCKVAWEKDCGSLC
jgi:hypothetical protein